MEKENNDNGKFQTDLEFELKSCFFEKDEDLFCVSTRREKTILNDNKTFMQGAEKKLLSLLDTEQAELFRMYQFFLFGYLFNREELIERKVKRGEAFSVKSNAAERAIRIIKSRNGQV